MTDQRSVDPRLGLPANADAIRDEQVSRTRSRLEASGGLTPRQRVAIEQLGDRLTAALRALFDADEQSCEDAAVAEVTRERQLCQD